MKITARALATARTQETEPDSLLVGHLREVEYWDASLEDHTHYRWDFAYLDPASGGLWQYGVDQAVVETISPASFEERVRAPARAMIARMLRRKCGIRAALANQVPFSAPRTGRTRYV
jgi:hypothetical protein